jgi:hypothetical protein
VPQATVGDVGLDQLRKIRRRWRTLRRRLQRPVDCASLVVQLRQAGGNAPSGAQAVVQALQQAVGAEGTILMPAYASAD